MNKLYLYGIKENCLSDFHKKYGWKNKFSEIFPYWKKTTLSKKNIEMYGYKIIVYAKESLNKEIIEKYNLSFVDEVLEE